MLFHYKFLHFWVHSLSYMKQENEFSHFGFMQPPMTKLLRFWILFATIGPSLALFKSQTYVKVGDLYSWRTFWVSTFEGIAQHFFFFKLGCCPQLWILLKKRGVQLCKLFEEEMEYIHRRWCHQGLLPSRTTKLSLFFLFRHSQEILDYMWDWEKRLVV